MGEAASSFDAFIDELENEFSQYLLLRYRSARLHDVAAQVALDAWLEKIQPKLKERGTMFEKDGFSWDEEILRITTTFRP
jgi:hypothetical protein